MLLLHRGSSVANAGLSSDANLILASASMLSTTTAIKAFQMVSSWGFSSSKKKHFVHAPGHSGTLELHKEQSSDMNAFVEL